ncbi:MAG: TetR/AcrR family transcriptional regulator, partial [Alloalcanivorax venustensis]
MPGAKEKPAARKSKSGAKNGTRLDLTLAAEKVFALNGLHGATLRQIREEAGQKNESVIHYHFGSREAIIESILHLRSKPMDEARTAMLEQIRTENNGVPLSSEQIARCCLFPLAHYLLDGQQAPGYYMRFLAQLRVNRSAWRQFSGLHDRG